VGGWRLRVLGWTDAFAGVQSPSTLSAAHGPGLDLLRHEARGPVLDAKTLKAEEIAKDQQAIQFGTLQQGSQAVGFRRVFQNLPAKLPPTTFDFGSHVIDGRFALSAVGYDGVPEATA
jgi:hypothetical protein